MNYKKILLIFLVFLVFLNSSYSFEVYDGLNNKREHFSFSENNVIVKHSSDNSLLFVDYNLIDNKMTKSFPFSKCENNYCAYFSMSDLFSGIQEDTITVSSSIDLRIGDSKKTIFFDAIPPEIKSEITLDKFNKKMIVKMNYNDNKAIKELSFSLNGKKIKNYSSFNENKGEIIYNYSITKSGDYNFVFDISDKAENEKTLSKQIKVGDIFEPTIKNLKLEKLLNEYKLTFSASDDVLISSISILEDSSTDVEEVSKKEKNFEYTFPLSTKRISLALKDSSSNILKKELDLTKKIIIEDFTEKINKREISFNSSSDISCKNTHLNKDTYSQNFQKSGKNFKLILKNEIEEKENTIKFICNEEYYYETFEYSFYYDKTPPKKTDLVVKSFSSHFVDFSWDNSYESNLNFKLFKNGKEIYSGNKNSFVDDEISYPNVYNYYLRIFDNFKNYVDSKKVEITPNPDKVLFNTQEKNKTTLNQSSYNFSFSVPLNSKIYISVLNKGKEFFSKNFTNEKENVTIPLTLMENENKIILKITDEYKNELEKTFLISYNNPDKKIKFFFSNVSHSIFPILKVIGLVLIFIFVFFLCFFVIKKVKFNIPKKKVHKILKKKESKSTLNFDNEISKRKEYYKKLRESRKKSVQKKEKLQEVKEESLENRKVEDYSLKTKEISILLFKIQKYNTLSKDIFGKKYLENLIFGIEKKITHFGGTLIREKKGEFMIIFGAPRTHSDLTNISGAVNLCLELKKEVSQINKLILKSYEEEDEKLINKEKIDFSCLIVFDKFKVGNFGGVNFFDYDVSGELVPVITKKIFTLEKNKIFLLKEGHNKIRNYCEINSHKYLHTQEKRYEFLEVLSLEENFMLKLDTLVDKGKNMLKLDTKKIRHKEKEDLVNDEKNKNEKINTKKIVKDILNKEISKKKNKRKSYGIDRKVDRDIRKFKF